MLLCLLNIFFFRNVIHDDSVSFYALVSKYRTPEYAQINSGWILLESAEQLFRLARGRVFNTKNGSMTDTYVTFNVLILRLNL